MSHELARIEALEKRVTKLEKLLKSREGSEKWGEDSVVQQQQQQGQEISMKAGMVELVENYKLKILIYT